MHTILRKVLHSLQQAGGAYCIVAAHKDHDARASLRGFQEGDNLRVLRPKEEKVTGVERSDAHLLLKAVGRYPGYALKMIWDVPVGIAAGNLKVNICWHDVVFRNEWGFTERNFLY